MGLERVRRAPCVTNTVLAIAMVLMVLLLKTGLSGAKTLPSNNNNYLSINISMAESHMEELELPMESHASRMLAGTAGCGTAKTTSRGTVFYCPNSVQYTPCLPCPVKNVKGHCPPYQRACPH